MDLSFISLAQGRCPPWPACAAPRFDLLALVKPQFELGQGTGRQGRSGARRRGPARSARVPRETRPARPACPCTGTAPRACPARPGTARASCGAATTRGPVSRTWSPRRGRRSPRSRSDERDSCAEDPDGRGLHARPSRRDAPRRSGSSPRWQTRPGWSCVFDPDQGRRPTSASCSVATVRRCARSASTPVRGCRSSRSTSAGSDSSPPWTARTCRRSLELALSGQFEVASLPALVTDGDVVRALRDQRDLVPAASGDQHRAPVVLTRGRMGRARAVRRPDRRDPGGIDRLQPVGRRPDRRMGREGVRREPDRTACAQLPSPGRGTGGRAARGERRQRSRGRRDRRNAHRRAGSERGMRDQASRRTSSASRSSRARASTAASAKSCSN